MHLLLTLGHKVSLPLLANIKKLIDAIQAHYDFGIHTEYIMILKLARCTPDRYHKQTHLHKSASAKLNRKWRTRRERSMKSSVNVQEKPNITTLDLDITMKKNSDER